MLHVLRCGWLGGTACAVILAAVGCRSTPPGSSDGGATTTSAVAPGRWCALPRPEEPLLADARDVADRRGTLGDAAWFHGAVAAGATVAVIDDEATCREASLVYSGGTETVLVVRVGDLYLVDDQKPRRGGDAVWHVDVLDLRLRPTIFTYGGGA